MIVSFLIKKIVLDGKVHPFPAIFKKEWRIFPEKSALPCEGAENIRKNRESEIHGLSRFPVYSPLRQE